MYDSTALLQSFLFLLTNICKDDTCLGLETEMKFVNLHLAKRWDSLVVLKISPPIQPQITVTLV